MYVCCCLGVTDRSIRTAIRNGACSVEDIVRCSGAGSRCGSCKPEIQAMLAQAADAITSSSGPSHRHLSMHVEQNPAHEHEGRTAA
jgi:bacterioferritin-associated ferredoxin